MGSERGIDSQCNSELSPKLQSGPNTPKNENPAAGGSARGVSRDAPARQQNTDNGSRGSGRRQEARRPVSVYDGTRRAGRVEPAGAGFAAFDADDAPLGVFATFKAAVAAVPAVGVRHG
ncbi:hypothetical protein BLTE_08100 [Blastochloris tepida]|uniref:Uncharacterized protein n=1 Tax=Blastochloris tepida TaxID=2233851 RepID=A0A348FXU2_9HYPH|nr:hypothetical protein BLTE_08100 [Blastochloris tepida]